MIHLAYSNDMRGGGLKYLPSRSIFKPYEPTMAQLEHTIILLMNDATWPVAVIHPMASIGSLYQRRIAFFVAIEWRKTAINKFAIIYIIG